jgi:hypothetical protein
MIAAYMARRGAIVLGPLCAQNELSLPPQHLEVNAPLLLAYFRLYMYSVTCWCFCIESDDKSKEHAALLESCFRGRFRPMHVQLQLIVRNLNALRDPWLKSDRKSRKLEFAAAAAGLLCVYNHDRPQYDQYVLMIVSVSYRCCS